jgi:hypothetical protein
MRIKPVRRGTGWPGDAKHVIEAHNALSASGVSKEKLDVTQFTVANLFSAFHFFNPLNIALNSLNLIVILIVKILFRVTFTHSSIE